MQIARAFSIWPTAGPVVPIGKNTSGSLSRQAESSLQSVNVSMLLASFSQISCECERNHKSQFNLWDTKTYVPRNAQSKTVSQRDSRGILAPVARDLLWDLPDRSPGGGYCGASVSGVDVWEYNKNWQLSSGRL